MKIPLEDLFEDIVGKAQRGLQVSDQELSQQAHLSLEELRALKKGSGTPAAVSGLAEALGLGAESVGCQLFQALGIRRMYLQLTERNNSIRRLSI